MFNAKGFQWRMQCSRLGRELQGRAGEIQDDFRLRSRLQPRLQQQVQQLGQDRPRRVVHLSDGEEGDDGQTEDAKLFGVRSEGLRLFGPLVGLRQGG